MLTGESNTEADWQVTKVNARQILFTGRAQTAEGLCSGDGLTYCFFLIQSRVELVSIKVAGNL